MSDLFNRPGWLLVAFCLLAGACRQKQKAEVPPIPTPTIQETSTATPQPSSTPAPTAPVILPAQTGSTLRVRVIFGGASPQTFPAALVQREELANSAISHGKTRFVLTCMQEWNAGLLSNPNTRLFIDRNTLDQQTTIISKAFPARLVRFDDKTSIALLSYEDSFLYDDDTGFRLARKLPNQRSFDLIRVISDSPEDNRAIARQGPPFSLEAGSFLPDAASNDRIRLYRNPSSTLGSSEVFLVVSVPDNLIGFVSMSGKTVTFTPVGETPLEIKTTAFAAAGLSFAMNGSGSVTVVLTMAPPTAGKGPEQITLFSRIVDDNAAPDSPQPQPDGSFPPIAYEGSDRLRPQLGETNKWTGSLAAPSGRVGNQMTYAVQFGWPLYPGNNSDFAYSRPFIINLKYGEDGVYPTIRGFVSNSPTASSPVDPSARKFDLPSPAQSVHLIAGGREALLEFAEAPYWKRFSFERQDWLPLPVGDLSNVSLTGNLNALFLIDRRSAKVTKYNLNTLTESARCQLPPSTRYRTILAGCNSAHSPVHVILKDNSIALSPDSLQRFDVAEKEVPDASNPAGSIDSRRDFFITGDGLAVIAGMENQWLPYFYNRERSGLERTLADLERGTNEQLPGVSAAYEIVYDGLQSRATDGGKPSITPISTSNWHLGAASLSENCPVTFCLLPPEKDTVPPQPPRLELRAFSDSAPFATVSLPEMRTHFRLIAENTLKTARWFFLDPYSQRLGTLSFDRQTFYVRQLSTQIERDQPVLLNWPDNTIGRGGTLEFEPVFLGKPATLTARLVGQARPVDLDHVTGSLRFAVRPDEFFSMLLLELEATGKKGEKLRSEIPIQINGPQLPIIVPPNEGSDAINSWGAGFSSLGGAANRRVLASDSYLFNDGIIGLRGPVAGHLVVLTAANRIDFFSLLTRKVVGSIPCSVKAGYYAGAGALYEYDAPKKSLTRIAVPSGRRETTITIPPETSVNGIGIGTDPASPVTLSWRTENLKAIDESGIYSKKSDRGFRILDGTSLIAKNWAQPTSVEQIFKPSQKIPPDFFGLASDLPNVLPTSHNGLIINEVSKFVALGKYYSITYPYANSTLPDEKYDTWQQTTGSISGSLTTSQDGRTFLGGLPLTDSAYTSNRTRFGSPCGRYRLQVVTDDTQSRSPYLKVYSVAQNELLFKAARFELLRGDSCLPSEGRDMTGSYQGLMLLGDNGPLAIVGLGSHALQIADFDIPRLAREISPDSLHVISQPPMVAVHGYAFTYQIQVNNPAAFASAQMHTPIPGASISSQGLFQYMDQGSLSGPKMVNISIDILTKNGARILHEFPLYIFPPLR